MIRKFMIAAASATVLGPWQTLLARQPSQYGKGDEARAMLDKAVATAKADQAVALAMFIKGEGGFRDRDLYPFCFRNGDGKAIASPPAVPAGTDVRTLKDQTGNAYGLELYAAAQNPEGQITDFSYMFPSPVPHPKPLPKPNFIPTAAT